MNTDHAKHVVVASIVITGAVGGITRIAHGHPPTIRQTVGVFGAGAVLLLAAEPFPQLAASLAALMAVATVFTSGGQAFETIGKAVN